MSLGCITATATHQPSQICQPTFTAVWSEALWSFQTMSNHSTAKIKSEALWSFQTIRHSTSETWPVTDDPPLKAWWLK